MKKNIIITSVLLLILLITSGFVFNNMSSNYGVLPPFNVKVFQYGGTTPQPNARVDYKQGGSVVATGITGSDGVFYITLPTGTYDVAVCYPDRPNDSSSGVLNNHYHSVGETVNITLNVFY